MDGQTPDHGHPISSPCEPNGSGELKIGTPLHTPVLLYKSGVYRGLSYDVAVFQWITSCNNQRTIGPENSHLKPDLGVLGHHEMTLTLNTHTPLLTS